MNPLMGIATTVKSCFSNYVSVAGTASRREFWAWIFFALFVLGITTIVDGAVIAPALGFLPFEHDAGTPLSLVASLVLLPPTITVAARRLHDSGWSAWWLLVALTGVGLIPLLWFFVRSGKKTDNRFAAEDSGPH